MYNDTNISFEVDARQFIVADKKLAKRTAQQQTPLEILRVCNDPAVVRGHQRQRTVFALPKLTIADDKVLLLEIIEKNGARHQTTEITSRVTSPRREISLPNRLSGISITFRHLSGRPVPL